MSPISVRQLDTSYIQRYQNTQKAPHRNLSGGMVRDIASYLAPEGSCYDAVGMLCDLPGKIRKRGGWTSPAAGNSAATVEHIVGFKSNAIDAITALIGSSGKGGASATLFNSSTGGLTTLLTDGSSAVYACRPFQHRNYIVLPFQILGTTTNDRNKLFFAGGATAAATITGGTATTGDNRITSMTGTALTASMLGGIIWIFSSGTDNYFGRVVEITSSTSCRVDPPVTTGFTIASGGQILMAMDSNPLVGGSPGDVTGRFGVSFQGRIVFGDTVQTKSSTSSTYAKGIDRKPRRVWWSNLETEIPPLLNGGTPDGEVCLMPGFFINVGTAAGTVPTFNWVDIDDLQTMTGLAAAGPGQLIVFGPRQMFAISGQLATETVQDNQQTWSVDQISSNVGCVAAKSIQYTRYGLIFLGLDNVYLYDGHSAPKPILGENSRYVQARLRAGATVHGSAYSANRNHYCLSLSDGALIIDLDTYALTRDANIDLFDSTPDPADATKLWGVRWWDTTGANPTMTKGQLIGLESIWLPTSANQNDADGTALRAAFQSKAYMDGTLEANKLFREVYVDADLRGSGSPTASVTADTKLNVSDASFTALTQGTIASGTAPTRLAMDTTNQLTEGKAIEVQIVQAAAADSFEILGINVGFQERALT